MRYVFLLSFFTLFTLLSCKEPKLQDTQVSAFHFIEKYGSINSFRELEKILENVKEELEFVRTDIQRTKNEFERNDSLISKYGNLIIIEHYLAVQLGVGSPENLNLDVFTMDEEDRKTIERALNH